MNKITVEKGELLKALTIVKDAIRTNPIIPIIEGIRLTANDGVLTLQATDLDLAVSCSISYIGEASFDIVVSKILIETLKTLPEQPLIIEVSDNDFFVLKTTNGEFKTPAESGMDFPKMSVVDNLVATISNFEEFIEVLKEAANFASSDEKRPAMNGINFAVKDGVLELCTTDAHFLYLNKELKIDTKDTSFILPKGVIKLLDGFGLDEEVTIKRSENNLSFSCGEIVVQCRLIDGRFPDYYNAIPNEIGAWLELETEELKTLLKQVNSYTNNTTRMVRMENVGTKLHIQATDLDFQREAKVSGKLIEGHFEMAMGFNSLKLQTILKSIGSDVIRIDAISPSRAALFNPVGRDNVVFLCMPIMLT